MILHRKLGFFECFMYVIYCLGVAACCMAIVAIPRAIPVQRKPVTSEGVGEWTGEASKGFAKGFVKGLMKKKEAGNEQANN